MIYTLTSHVEKLTLTGKAAINATTNKDAIMDFNVVDDTIRLENAIMTTFMTTGTLSGQCR